MSLVKNLLHGMGMLRLASRFRDGKWRHLRGGYTPKSFWEGWGNRFAGQRFQHGIYAAQEWLRDRIQASPGTRVLEVGCGFGRNLEYLARTLGAGKHLAGIDISPSILRKGRASLPAACGLACGDIQSLPFPDGAFDSVFTHGVLMHVPPPNLAGALAEIRRVCKGDIFFAEETYWKGMARGSEVDVNGFTFFRDYAAMLPGLGFRVLEAGETGEKVNIVLIHCRPA